MEKKIGLWFDRWFDDGLLKNQFPTIYSVVLDQECELCDRFFLMEDGTSSSEGF